MGWAAALGLILFLTTGCRHLTVDGDPYIDQTPVEVTAPESLAILPTTFDDGDAALAHRMRLALYAALSPLPFEDRELSLVDGRLADIATELGVRPNAIPPVEMVDNRLADCIVYSHISRIGSLWLLFYAERSINLDFTMVDTRTQRVLYRNHFVIHDRRGAPFYSLFGMIEAVGETLWHLKSSQTEESMEEGARKIAEWIPLPILPAAKGSRLQIHEVRVLGDLPALAAGETLRVQAEATQGMHCTFSIGGISGEVEMPEVAPGVYEGSYVIRKGDDKPYAVVEVTLEAPQGEESIAYVEALQPFSIDTIPPPAAEIDSWWPAGSNGVYLSFKLDKQPEAGEPDEVTEYQVYRRGQGESDFAQVGTTGEFPWLDRGAQRGQRYDYYLRTRDAAGNTSEPGRTRRVEYP